MKLPHPDHFELPHFVQRMLHDKFLKANSQYRLLILNLPLLNTKITWWGKKVCLQRAVVIMNELWLTWPWPDTQFLSLWYERRFYFFFHKYRGFTLTNTWKEIHTLTNHTYSRKMHSTSNYCLLPSDVVNLCLKNETIKGKIRKITLFLD